MFTPWFSCHYVLEISNFFFFFLQGLTAEFALSLGENLDLDFCTMWGQLRPCTLGDGLSAYEPLGARGRAL
jgi:hypothetical protein